MSKELIMAELKKRSDKIIFNEEEHTYTINDYLYTSVSNVLSHFKTKYDFNPNGDFYRDRGTVVHQLIEKYCEFVKMKDAITIEQFQKVIVKLINNNEWVNNIAATEDGTKELKKLLLTMCLKAYVFLNKQFEKGYEVLATEQMVYDIPNKIAGSIDLLLYKEDDNKITIKVVDWKTGTLKMENYPQIEMYRFMVSKTINKNLRKKLNKKVEVKTKLVSLK